MALHTNKRVLFLPLGCFEMVFFLSSYHYFKHLSVKHVPHFSGKNHMPEVVKCFAE